MLANGYSRAKRYLTSEGLGPLLVRALAGSGAVRVGAMAASFLVGVQLARGLGAAGYGYYGMALSVITIAGIPGELGLSRLVTREVATSLAGNDDRHVLGILRWAVATAVRVSAIVAIGVIAVGLLLIHLGNSALGFALLLGAPAVLAMALSRIYGGALQGLRYVVRGQIPANLLRPLFFSLMLFGTWFAGVEIRAPSAMALNSFTSGLAMVVAYRWLRRRLPNVAAPDRAQSGRSWLASSIPMALTQGMLVLQSELSVLLLGLISPAATVGVFRIAISTAVAAAAAIPVVIHVAFPVIARLHAEGDVPRLQKAVTAFAAAQVTGVLLLSLPLLIAPGPILLLAFGQQFVPAATPLLILVVGQIVNAAFGPNIVLLNMTHHERRVTRATGIALALNVVTVPLLAAWWGANGAAVGLVLSTACWNAIAWLDAKRLMGIETSAIGCFAAGVRARLDGR